MSEIEFSIDGHPMSCRDIVYVGSGESAREALIRGVITSISTDLEVTVGGVTMHLAAWMDPDDWASDWETAGVDDVGALLD